MAKELDEFISKYDKELNIISALKMIHYQCRKCIDANDFKGLKSLLNIFNQDLVNINVLKTILIVTAEFKNNEEIKDVRHSLKVRFDKHLIKACNLGK